MFSRNSGGSDQRSNDEELFYEEVSNHEQLWGRSSYEGRPTLAEIMKAKIVVVWYPITPKVKMNPIITTHNNLQAINDFVAAFMLHSESGLPKTRLARIFYHKHEIKIQGVKLIFDVPDALKKNRK